MIQKIPALAYRFLRHRHHFFAAAGLCRKWTNLAFDRPLPESINNAFDFIAKMERGLCLVGFISTVEKSVSLYHKGSWEKILVMSGKVICLASRCAVIAAEDVFNKKIELPSVVKRASAVSDIFLSGRGLWKMSRKAPKTGFQCWEFAQKGLSKVLFLFKQVGFSIFPGWARVCLNTSLFATDFFKFASEERKGEAV